MNYVWSPWRMTYIQSNNREEACVFCREVLKEDCIENLVVARGQKAFVIINRYPYTSGHLMIVPFIHKPSLELLDAQTRAEIMELASRAIQVLQAEYHPQGFNLGINIGTVAGAGIADHVHLHVVPRWGGDTNFMSTLAETRVLPESLEDTYRRVRDRWEKLDSFPEKT
ncbi:MAG: HIT family protein [Omnitrophica WOR_2 bacterium]